MDKNFVVRFSRADKHAYPNTEEYYYNTKEEADHHLDLFVEDDSGLYRNIALLDLSKMLVLRILTFENGTLRADFKDRGIVRLRSGYRTSTEAALLFSITNIHEDTGRCLITCLNSEMPIPASETVGLEMIDMVVDISDLM